MVVMVLTPLWINRVRTFFFISLCVCQCSYWFLPVKCLLRSTKMSEHKHYGFSTTSPWGWECVCFPLLLLRPWSEFHCLHWSVVCTHTRINIWIGEACVWPVVPCVKSRPYHEASVQWPWENHCGWKRTNMHLIVCLWREYVESQYVLPTFKWIILWGSVSFALFVLAHALHSSSLLPTGWNISSNVFCTHTHKPLLSVSPYLHTQCNWHFPFGSFYISCPPLLW